MTRPEIAKTIKTGTFNTNYHDQGEGFPLLLAHGSGPGVSAWANWRLVIPELSKNSRVLAPDMVGFGYTDRPEGIELNMKTWVQQAIDFLDALGIEQTDIVGNSFGGALAIALAIEHPHRIRRMVLMGAMGVNFEISPGLDSVWGYTPSVENMKEMLNLFVYDKSIATDDLAKMRYEASIEPGFQESFAAMFPEPRQEWVDFMAYPDEEIAKIKHHTLIVHGREDMVIPISNSYKLINLIDDAQLHVFGHCGHWTQIEQAGKFNTLVANFLAE
ncbi:2-hydroxymuconate-semialdehyde hydrolase [Breznakia sp. PF5-3]|uniref:alpha/beta fold hydrolase n=1 Tax=unclassified Breznakia TaxID=2623764 RepID=UPI00240719C8|nr:MULTISPECIES: alpha/beta hydrolase [unclassified Breznakia]MDL2276215.1 alpha/beta fold hydrolase [Breznakia sp. OttesenSCG-928-G09]MDF9825039.1 2-hydroxymuconate-semialdehyde hydrolase [Breznakia sp. PM6-1]MDF9835886.1 2-hydroxymuconate-semialdehyde hydrolase [Breznakia sp. PF5-3]MDF9837347.1 2-hydroxymuconate-semialdehyde hydrolase [Breznakia sp. PFB2-8]MDF9859282.1 2-hydroxymuconate-semialdehyde hydrolase [Breznakia sp. PH5-24]